MKAKCNVISTDEHTVVLHFDDTSATDYFNKNSECLLRIDVKKWKDDRSLDQNAFLWACIGDICKHMSNHPDKWSVYLELLKRYGEFAFLMVETEKLDKFIENWREVEVLNEVVGKNGKKYTYVRAYYGSHLLDTEEMSRLLTGTVEEMKHMGIPLPPTREMQELLKRSNK